MHKLFKLTLKKYKQIDKKLKANNFYNHLSIYLHLAYKKYLTSYNKDMGKGFYNYNYDFIEPDANHYFFDSYWGKKIGCNPFAIYQELVRRKTQGTFIWVKNKGVTPPYNMLNASSVIFIEYASAEYAYYLLKSKYLIFNSNLALYFSKKKGQTLVNTWHGTPIKKLGLDIHGIPLVKSVNSQRNFNMADIIPLSSEYTKNKTVDAYGAYFCERSIAYTGSPRVDLIKNSNPAALRERLKIDRNKKIILYAPTWKQQETQKITEETLHILNDCLNSKIIYTSLHHLTKQAIQKKIDINEIPDNIDTTEFLSIVDVLISDYSSIIIDYLYLNRPTVIYAPDHELYTQEQGLYPIFHQLPVNYAFSQTELKSALFNLKKPDQFNHYDKAFDNLLTYEKGNACKKVADQLNKIKNKKNEKNISLDTESKKNIIFFPGTLITNGITQSFISLIKNLKSENLRIFVIIDCSARTDANFNENLKQIQEVGKLILFSRRKKLSENKEILYKKYFHDKNQPLTKEIREIFEDEIESLVKNHQFDLAVDFTGYSPFWSNFIALTNSKSKVIYQHSDMWAEHENPERKNNLFPVFKSYSLYDKIISVSDEVAKTNKSKLIDYYNHASDQIAIENCIDTHRILALAKSPILIDFPNLHCAGLDSSITKFISVSRLSNEKNLETLIRAFALLVHQEEKKAILIIVGSGPTEKKLKVLANNLGVFEFILFTGLQKNPYRFINQADCLVFPSKYEGQGLALLEAMTLGKYCIASDLPVTRAILSNQYGSLACASDEGFCKKMLEFIEHRPSPKPFDSVNYQTQAANHFLQLLES